MSIFAPVGILRAAATLAVVWMLAPNQPDPDPGRPRTIETLLAETPDAPSCVTGWARGSAMLGALMHTAGSFEQSHRAVVSGIERVRADLHANGRHL